MPNDNDIGTVNPTGDSLGDVSGKTISFPLNNHGEREIKVDAAISQAADDIVEERTETAPTQSQKIDNQVSQPVDKSVDNQPQDDFQSRYKELQSYTTKTSQENARIREENIRLQKDLEYVTAYIKGQQKPTPPEDWNELTSSKENFESFLKRRDEASEQRILAQVANFLGEHLQSDPVRRESEYRMGLDRAVSQATKDGMDIKAMKDSISQIMDMHRDTPGFNFDHAYQMAKRIAPKPLNGMAVQNPTSDPKQIIEKANRFATEKDNRSTDISRPQLKPVKPGDSRDMMEQAFNNSLEYFGLS